MNRLEEYHALSRELESTPPELSGTVERARRRYRRWNGTRRLGMPLASLGGAAAAFILLVNFSLPFALACRSVPVLRDLAQAVAVSPSLRAAFEHDYVQPVGQTRSENGVTFGMEYIIVDEKQLNLFYTLKSDRDSWLDITPVLLDENGNKLSGYSAQWGMSAARNQEDYLLATFYFSEGTIPEHFDIQVDVREDTSRSSGGDRLESTAPAPDDGPWPEEHSQDSELLLASFDFPIQIDSSLVMSGQTLSIGRWIELDGQRVELNTLSVHPTQAELTLKDDPENSAWLTGLDCYLEDEKGNRYEQGGNSYGDAAGTPFTTTYTLESCYFENPKHLTLHIDGATWLDKDSQSVTLSLTDSSFHDLPEGLTVERFSRDGENVYLSLQNTGPARLSWSYLDPEGGEHSWNGGSTSAVDEDGDGHCEVLTEYRVLRDYPWDTVTLRLSANRETKWTSPISIPIK